MENNTVVVNKVDAKFIKEKYPEVYEEIQRERPGLKATQTSEPTPELPPEVADRLLCLGRNLIQARKMTNASSVETVKPPEPVKPMTDEELWKSDPKLRNEFINLDNFKAYRKAVESGRVKVLSGSRV
ncbi:MAG TPA: hypothetical protein ACFYEK_04285 [Candidatus Wunengus sp. YC60]|uniref:hypothetical protein n=1 Tax=Candidatus Wunengus sp. YC60 TaxID=3367697 RepID=UPI004026DBF0